MPRVDPQQPLLPSLLDRLLDREPDVTTEPAWYRSQSLRDFESSVLRDLEALLNTRQLRPNLATESCEIASSLLTYGLPEFSAVGVGSQQEREQLRHAVLMTISRFEPRLRDVQVTLHDPTDQFDRSLKMTIEALLWVHPDPLPISFDTFVEPSSGQCTVKSKSA